MPKEYRAFIPKNRYDFWSQDVFTKPVANLHLLELNLESWRKMGVEGIKLYEREVSPWEEVKDVGN